MDIYTDYAKTRQQMQVLTDKLKSLENSILEEIKNVSTPVKNDFGTFSTVKRTIIKLSDPAIKKQQKVKDQIKSLVEPLNIALKQIEEQDIKKGNATVEQILSMRFIEKKDK